MVEMKLLQGHEQFNRWHAKATDISYNDDSFNFAAQKRQLLFPGLCINCLTLLLPVTRPYAP